MIFLVREVEIRDICFGVGGIERWDLDGGCECLLE